MPRRASEGGACQLATRIPRDLHRAVKFAAFADEVSLKTWIADALDAYLAGRRGKPGSTADEDAPRTRVGAPPRRAPAAV